MNKADIKGKWALVTGASRGIGRQVSLGLADYGCNVILHSRDSAHTATLAEELTAKGVQVKQVVAELSDETQVDAMLVSLLSDGPAIEIVGRNYGPFVAVSGHNGGVVVDDIDGGTVTQK